MAPDKLTKIGTLAEQLVQTVDATEMSAVDKMTALRLAALTIADDCPAGALDAADDVAEGLHAVE